MINFENRFWFNKKSFFQVVGIVLLLLVGVVLLWRNKANSNQASASMMAQVYFEGEYRIGDGQWKKIEEGKHISSTKGDVTLRGNFHMLTPDGEYIGPLDTDAPIAFYMDHINAIIYEEGQEPYVMDDENPLFGVSACGENWNAHLFENDGAKQVEIVIHNPHRFGNETAVDTFLSNIAIWGNIDFERNILARGENQRNIGLVFIVVSFVLLGTALFSMLIHIKMGKIVWLLGLIIFFAGTSFMYSAEGGSFWSESIISNTTILGLSMVFYSLFLTVLISHFLKKTKKIGEITIILLGVGDAVFLVIPLLSAVCFYDTWLFWALVQIVVNGILLVCLLKEGLYARGKERWNYFGMILPLAAFVADFCMTFGGTWKGGVVSKYVFVVLFVSTMIVILRIIPRSVNATTKAKELEMEKMSLDAQLAESRISTMISQIRPHFIYNTLGSIEQLCEIDPPKAGELVHNFAKYLRGNFRELDNPKPIRMSQEMDHVHHYVSIEKVRFPDMTFSFEMNSEDFSLPALTVQPIVENAIKHGLMKLQKGGTICVRSFETDSHYCVSVEDDGVGFDTNILRDEREHVGIRNIRGRLKEMVDGALEIESTPGVGTKVLITIPKEV